MKLGTIWAVLGPTDLSETMDIVSECDTPEQLIRLIVGTFGVIPKQLEDLALYTDEKSAIEDAEERLRIRDKRLIREANQRRTARERLERLTSRITGLISDGDGDIAVDVLISLVEGSLDRGKPVSAPPDSIFRQAWEAGEAIAGDT